MTRSKVIVSVGELTERPMRLGFTYAPPVKELKDGYLIYNDADRVVRPFVPGLLAGFLQLSDADDAAIMKFAKHWGALRIDSEGWPGFEEHERHSVKEVYGREPTNAWRQVAKKFQAAIDLAADMNQGKTGSLESWSEFNAHHHAFIEETEQMERNSLARLRPKFRKVDNERILFANAIREMIRRYRVSPRFWWNHKANQWQIDLDSEGPNLLALMTIQTMIIVADKEGFAICSSCHRTYIPARKPDPTRRNYCPKCGMTAAWRDAARDKRTRDRERKEKEKENAKTKAGK